MTLTALVVDDHPMCRVAASIALAAVDPTVRIVEVACLSEMLDLDGDYDIIILDLNLLDSSGLSTLSIAVDRFPKTPILVISGIEDAGMEGKIIMLGATAYMTKTADISEIAIAVSKTLGTAIFANSKDSDLGAESIKCRNCGSATDISSLSPAEKRVLVKMSDGSLNKQIAYDLGLSEMTIKQHIRSIFKKLKVYNRTQAVIIFRDQYRMDHDI